MRLLIDNAQHIPAALRRYPVQLAVVALLALVTVPAQADKLDDAYRLLRITGAGKNFELATHRQTTAVIREYSVIVETSTDSVLPETIEREIRQCYSEALAWDRVEPGIAAIFAENLSESELSMLIDFLSDKSVPPPMIDQFKAMVAKADAIEQLAIEFMFNNTDSCERDNVSRILDYLADQGS